MKSFSRTINLVYGEFTKFKLPKQVILLGKLVISLGKQMIALVINLPNVVGHSPNSVTSFSDILS